MVTESAFLTYWRNTCPEASMAEARAMYDSKKLFLVVAMSNDHEVQYHEYDNLRDAELARDVLAKGPYLWLEMHEVDSQAKH